MRFPRRSTRGSCAWPMTWSGSFPIRRRMRREDGESPMKAPPTDGTVVRFEIAPRTVALILATMAGLWLLRELWVVVLLVGVARVFAGTFHPRVAWMERRGLGRIFSLILLFVGSILLGSLLPFPTPPPLAPGLAP